MIEPTPASTTSRRTLPDHILPMARFYNTLPDFTRSSGLLAIGESTPMHSRATLYLYTENESESETDNKGDDSEPGEFPAFDKRRLKAKDQRLQDRKSRRPGTRTQRKRKQDNNLNRGLLADIDEKHRPLVSNAIEIYTSLVLDEDPLGLEPAKARARVAMRQASTEDGTLRLKPNQFVVRLVSKITS